MKRIVKQRPQGVAPAGRLDPERSRRAKAPGKIILSGEYAVVFGYPGIAVPAPLALTATFEENPKQSGIEITWNEKHAKTWDTYLRNIISRCQPETGGILTIDNALPLGKGMGSSTALVIAVTKALLGDDCRDTAIAIEDAMNPGHSGIDFAVIFGNRPLLFRHGDAPKPVGTSLFRNITKHTVLIDTGAPKETTPELVAWVKSRKGEPDVAAALRMIGDCTERLLRGEDVVSVLRDHHRAQIALGVVPPKVRELIKKIEQCGGAAKVIGAGGRTGGGGMVLAFSVPHSPITPFPVIPLWNLLKNP